MEPPEPILSSKDRREILALIVLALTLASITTWGLKTKPPISAPAIEAQ